MTPTVARQWVTDQLRLDHCLCLILDALQEPDARRALLSEGQPDTYRSVYSETPAASLEDVGPLIFLISSAANPHLHELLEHPARNWGWLASIHRGQLAALTAHWRDRVLSGERPDQALYRFHDNRVLARALAYLPETARAAYLGPAISVCYWHDDTWHTADNPAPGQYPLPAEPPWLHVPLPEDRALAVLHRNIYRYLWAEHSDALRRLGQHQDPSAWLTEHLSLARQWGWHTPQQLHFLVINRLYDVDHVRVRRWLPDHGETADAHYQRIFNEVQFWSQGSTT